MMLKAGKATTLWWQVIILVFSCSSSSLEPSTNFANNLDHLCHIILNIVLVVLLLLLLLLVVIRKKQRKECRSYQQEECGDMMSNGRHDVSVLEIGDIVLKSWSRITGFGAVIYQTQNAFAFRPFKDAFTGQSFRGSQS
jgi:hypothetical protein